MDKEITKLEKREYRIDSECKDKFPGVMRIPDEIIDTINQIIKRLDKIEERYKVTHKHIEETKGELNKLTEKEDKTNDILKDFDEIFNVTPKKDNEMIIAYRESVKYYIRSTISKVLREVKNEIKKHSNEPLGYGWSMNECEYGCKNKVIEIIDTIIKKYQ